MVLWSFLTRNHPSTSLHLFSCFFLFLMHPGEIIFLMPNLDSTQTLTLAAAIAAALYDLLILCAWECGIKKKKLQRTEPAVFLAFPTKGVASSSLAAVVATTAIVVALYDPLILCPCSTLPLHNRPSLSLSLSISSSPFFSILLIFVFKKKINCLSPTLYLLPLHSHGP